MSVNLFLLSIVCVVFCWSSLGKVFSASSFKKTLINLDVPGRYLNIVAVLIPLVELIFAIFLLFEKTRFVGELGILVLLVVFTGVLFRAKLKEQEVECSCFGDFVPGFFGWETLLRVLVLFVIVTYLIITRNKNIDMNAYENLYYFIASSCLVILYSYTMNIYHYIGRKYEH